MFRNFFESLRTEVAASVVLAILVLIVFVETYHGQLNGLLTPHRIDSIVLSLCVSAFTAFFIKAFPHAQKRLDEHTKHGKFKKFFGAVTSETRGAIMLFSRKTLSKGAIVKSRVEENGLIPPGVQAEAEGISSWIPAQDLRGANYVAGELAKMVKQTAYYRTDVDLETDQLDQIRATVFSFGLGFNEFTWRMITATDSKLFTVDISSSARTTFQPITDNIELPGYGVLHPEGDVDCAIVVRIVHTPPDGSPSRYFFVCAGRTATGTAVAGRFLANNWLDVFKLYNSEKRNLNKDSLLIVLTHKYNPLHGEDDLGEIAIDGNGDRLIRWWSPSPVIVKSRDDSGQQNPSLSTIMQNGPVELRVVPPKTDLNSN